MKSPSLHISRLTYNGNMVDLEPIHGLPPIGETRTISYKWESLAVDVEEVQQMIDLAIKKGLKIPKYIHPYPPYVKKFEYPNFRLSNGEYSLSSLEHVAYFIAQWRCKPWLPQVTFVQLLFDSNNIILVHQFVTEFGADLGWTGKKVL